MGEVARSEYLDAISSLKKRYKSVEEYMDWLGLPITVFRTGGREEPPVLVTGGSAGIEAASVYAALELVMHVDVERAVYIVPSRDPTGFHDASFVLSRLFQTPLNIERLSDIKAALEEGGAQVLVDDERLFAALTKNAAFAFSKDEGGLGAYGTLNLLKSYMGRGDLASKLEASRILIPAQLPSVDGVGLTGRFLTLFMGDDLQITSYDHLDAKYLPPEAQCIKALVDELEPGMVIDLHEWMGPGFNAAFPDTPLAGEAIVLDVLLSQVAEYGMPLTKVEEAEALGLSTLREGAVIDPLACGLASYVVSRGYGYAMSLRTSLHAALESRVATLVTACLSALNAYAVARL